MQAFSLALQPMASSASREMTSSDRAATPVSSDRLPPWPPWCGGRLDGVGLHGLHSSFPPFLYLGS